MSALNPAFIRVIFLGPLRDELGLDAAEIPWPVPAPQAAFWSALRDRFPMLKSRVEFLRIARENEFLDDTKLLRPGDELALIPPVSGG